MSIKIPDYDEYFMFFDNILQRLKNLEINYNTLMNKTNILEENNSLLLSKISTLEAENNKLKELIIPNTKKNIIKNIEEDSNLTQNCLSDSSIITEISETNKILNWLNIKSNKLTFNLLYRASKDGDSQEAFHKNCDEKGASLLLIQTKNNKKFGAYTSIGWKNIESMEWLDDNNSFLFSLDNNKKYKIIKSQYSLLPINGIWFGYNPNIGMLGNLLQDEGIEDISQKCFDIGCNGEISGGESFIAKEVEVFQVCFE